MLQLRAHKLQLKILDVAVKTLQAATKTGHKLKKKKKGLKWRENFQTSLMRPALPMPKPDKNTIHTHTEIYRPISLMNTDVQIFHKILVT